MNKKFLPFIIVGAFILAIFAWLFSGNAEPTAKLNSETKSENITKVKIAGKDIKVELALTDEAQEQGLSGRSELKEDEGMLFVFDTPDNYSFWMKDMNFAIDIVWINEDQKVIYIEKSADPESYPETFGPNPSLGKTKYVLEVSSGFSVKNNLKAGDKIEFVY
jgi:uncharacterized membrane protein (UPF0127 family)